MKPTRTRSNKRSSVLLLSLLAAVAAPFAASAAAETTFRDIKVPDDSSRVSTPPRVTSAVR